MKGSRAVRRLVVDLAFAALLVAVFYVLLTSGALVELARWFGDFTADGFR